MSSDLCASCPHPNSPAVPDGSDGCSRCRTCILRDCTSTISKTSRDGSVSLVDDDFPVVNFDSVKECYCKKVNRWMQLPRSADALYCDRETLYLVEFKNGSLKETLGKRLNPKDDEELGINLGQRDAPHREVQGQRFDLLGPVGKEDEMVSRALRLCFGIQRGQEQDRVEASCQFD